MSLPGFVLALAVSANPFLTEGRAQCDAQRWEKAEGSLRLAVAHPESTRDERREAHSLLARALAALGKLDEAQAAFADLLVKDAAAPEPAGASPKLVRLFRAAKESLYPPRYVRLTAVPSLPGQLAIDVADPWKLVARVVLTTADAELPLTLTEPVARGERPERCVSCVVLALDAAGERLSQLSLKDDAAPAPVAAAPTPVPAPAPAPAVSVVSEPQAAPSSSRVPRWLKVSLGILGFAALGGAGVLSGLSVSASSQAGRLVGTDAFGTQVLALDAQARTDAIAAWAVGATGVAVLVVTLVLVLVSP